MFISIIRISGNFTNNFYLCSSTDSNTTIMTAQVSVKRSAYTLFIFICLWLCPPAHSLPFRFVHYDVSNGLSGNCVRALTQDSRGFIWFGTDKGLNRFDGYSFKVFKHIAGDSTSIRCNYIYALHEDRGNKLWIGTETGVDVYCPRNEEFTAFSLQTEQGIGIESFITVITEDRQANLWFSTMGQGVFRYDPVKQTLKQFRLEEENICYLFVDSENTVWAAPKNAGMPLFRLRQGAEEFEPYILVPEAQKALTVYGMADFSDGYLWLGTWVNGLYRLNKATGEVKTFIAPGTPEGAFHIHSVLAYDAEFLLIGSDDGLHYFNTVTEEFVRMTATEFNDQGLSDKFIYPIYRDREGGVWIGTYYGGVNYSPPRKGSIEGFAHSDYTNSVNGNIISEFCEDAEGNIWIGSDDGGLSYFDVQSRTFRNYMPDPHRNSLSYHNVHALYLEGNQLWIGTYSAGLNILDLRTGRFSHYDNNPARPDLLDNNSIYSIAKDSDNRIWIGSMQGIMYYNRETDDFVHAKTTGTTTMDILDDGHRSVWFATSGKGLLRYNQRTGEWHQYVSEIRDEQTLPSNLVNALCVGQNGRLWIGTDDGLCYYDRATDSFVRVPLLSPSNSICDILSDGPFLWLTTTNGLVHISTESYSYRVLTQTDGLQSDQFTVKASLMSRSGKMYLGTINGFNIVDPRTISTNEHVPPVWITNLQIFNRNQQISPDGVLHQSIEYADEIELTYKQNVFSIEYASLSYSAPVKNQYKYKLEGFDKEWNEVGNQRKATYTNLPAGRYHFRVIASNNDEVWNSVGAGLQIIIHPPFWKTIWAYLLYTFLLLLAAGYLIYYQRKRTERKHQARIRKLQDEKEKELHDAKIHFFTLIAHEIRTPVSLIIGPLEKIMEDSLDLPEPVQSDLKIIDRNSQRLLSLVNQLLDFRKAEQGAFTIRLARHSVQELLQNIFIRFKPLIEQKGISFRMELPEQPVFATLDSEAITKVVSNLLTNAFKFGRKEIVIACTSDADNVSIRVTDDGRGIEPEEMKRIFRPFYQVAQNNVAGTGIGLSLVKLLVDAHSGTIQVKSQPNVATSFTVCLPLHQKETDSHRETDELRPAALIRSLTPEETPHERPFAMLIVEDNAEMRNFLCENFEWNYRILLAENGKEGLEKLRKHQVDIIISDVMMPVMDGIAFSRKVKDEIQYCHIPLILLTAKTDTDSKVSGIKSGADLYVEKPFSPQVLRAQVENLLNSRQVLRKKFSEMPFVPLNSVAGNKADEQFLAKLNKIIEKNISNVDFSIDLLAEQLCISRSGLFTKIKNLVGITPNELIQLIRLKKAAELLATKEFRINEICYQVGFNNPSYFSKCFQKQFGVLPKDFMNQPENGESQ